MKLQDLENKMKTVGYKKGKINHVEHHFSGAPCNNKRRCLGVNAFSTMYSVLNV